MAGHLRTILVCSLLVGVGCGGDSSAPDGGTDGGTADSGASPDGGADAGVNPNAYTLENCTTSVAAGVPDFFRDYFRCVTITTSAGGTVLASSGAPPHLTYYYGASSPNYAPFDTTRGPMYRPNPNKIVATRFQVTIPSAPIAKGITVTAALVDGVVGTSSEEYPLGPAGMALDSVALFNPLAAPGDDIENEKYTFDDFNAHPTQNGAYHYHTTSKGPLAILAGSPVELYGIMCDGTVVLGCTELDGSAPSAADFDAQGGHVHDLKNAAGSVLLAGRYHVHMCPSQTGGRRFTPEIQYYKTCTR